MLCKVLAWILQSALPCGVYASAVSRKQKQIPVKYSFAALDVCSECVLH